MTNMQLLAGATATVMTLLLSPPTVFAQAGAEYEVTVTNATRGQTFTPLAVVTHVAGAQLFRVGTPAISVLETVAEEGDVAPLLAAARALPPSVVFDAQSQGLRRRASHSQGRRRRYACSRRSARRSRWWRCSFRPTTRSWP